MTILSYVILSYYSNRAILYSGDRQHRLRLPGARRRELCDHRVPGARVPRRAGHAYLSFSLSLYIYMHTIHIHTD